MKSLSSIFKKKNRKRPPPPAADEDENSAMCNDILFHLFEYIDKPSDKLRCLLVCSVWRDNMLPLMRPSSEDLCAMIETGNEVAVRSLLDNEKLDLRTDFDSRQPVAVALLKGNVNILRQLLTRPWKLRMEEGRDAVYLSWRLGHRKAVHLFFDACANDALLDILYWSILTGRESLAASILKRTDMCLRKCEADVLVYFAVGNKALRKVVKILHKIKW